MRVSIYITSFNQKEFLKEAVESILNQTLKPFEILIVDDCSSDRSQELIKSYSIKYPELVKYIFHDTNKGVTQVRITALKNLSGDYVTYVDGDDLYLPTKLEKEVALLKGGNYDLAFSNNFYVDRDNVEKIKWIWSYNDQDLPPPGRMFIQTLSRDFPRNNLFRMELVNFKAWEKIGFHDPNLSIYEDYDMRIRLSKFMKINYTLEPLSKIRISKSGLSTSPDLKHLSAFRYIYQKYLSDIHQLGEKDKEYVEKRFQSFFRNFQEINSNRFSVKEIVVNKLISILKRL